MHAPIYFQRLTQPFDIPRNGTEFSHALVAVLFRANLRVRIANNKSRTRLLYTIVKIVSEFLQHITHVLSSKRCKDGATKRKRGFSFALILRWTLNASATLPMSRHNSGTIPAFQNEIRQWRQRRRRQWARTDSKYFASVGRRRQCEDVPGVTLSIQLVAAKAPTFTVEVSMSS